MTDVLDCFKAYDVRGRIPDQLNEDIARRIGKAYAEVIQGAGYEYPFRCGRATGYSFLEKPEIVFGDRTVIKPGMVLAIDGSVTMDSSFRAQVGDSFIVTDDGYEQLTSHSIALEDVIL